MSELDIKVSVVEGAIPVTILHLSGHLHGDTEPMLVDHAKQALEDGSRYLLLDLSNVDVLTSAGLRAIHNIFNLFTPQRDVDVIHQHGDEPYKSPYFKLVCPNPDVYYVLNIAGFLQNILIFNDLNEAIASFA
ncbi:MAG: STAS domain-containing protein [Anaerolineales bacterium]